MHNGETVEHVIRRSYIGISELSRRLRVSRRSVYNWFGQEDLSLDIICKIGQALNYDFSSEFPDKFKNGKIRSSDHIQTDLDPAINFILDPDKYLNSVNYWKNKYINLLEKYNAFQEHSAVN